MPFGYAELEEFFEGLVKRMRDEGVVCAITSGMACVEYKVAETTKDCDMLCQPDAASKFLKLLENTRLAGAVPRYRGKLSPPLDPRWMHGGWTSHFVWKSDQAEAYLDVFGVAPRVSGPWETETVGFYANPHTVAEMKRTDRDKDWPFITALGANMLDAGDSRGWLHIYDSAVLLDLLTRMRCPAGIVAKRPLLKLATARDPLLKQAMYAERTFWEELDRIRIRVYERALRPYLVAVRKSKASTRPTLSEEHETRLMCAEKHLLKHPVAEYGVDTLISEAQLEVQKLFPSALLEWLPDVSENFRLLNR